MSRCPVLDLIDCGAGGQRLAAGEGAADHRPAKDAGMVLRTAATALLQLQQRIRACPPRGSSRHRGRGRDSERTALEPRSCAIWRGEKRLMGTPQDASMAGFGMTAVGYPEADKNGA